MMAAGRKTKTDRARPPRGGPRSDIRPRGPGAATRPNYPPAVLKAIWVIALIVFPCVAVLAYLIFQGRGMAERNVQQSQQAREELRRVVGFSAADEIGKLERLKKEGSISDVEFTRLRARLV